MDSIIMRVRILHKDPNLCDLLKNMKPVDNVTTTFETVSYFGDYHGQQDILLISDDINALKPYLSEEKSDINIIYTGSPMDIYSAVDFYPQNVLDVWADTVTDEYKLFKLNRAITSHMTQYNAWLYKTWLFSLMDSLQDLVWFKDMDGLHWLVNSKLEKTVHKTRETMHGKGHNFIWDIPAEDEGKSELNSLETEREVMQSKSLVISDEFLKTDNGMRHFKTYKSPLFGRNGDVMGTVGIGHDVTDFNNTSIELEMLIDNIPIAMIICDKNWKPIEANRLFEKTFLSGNNNLSRFDYNKWKKSVSEILLLRHYNEKKRYYSEELKIVSNGSVRIFRVVEQEIMDYFGELSGYYCMFRDITKEREYENTILKFANTDALTELFNRRYFYEYIYSYKDEPMTVLFMDMDNFKLVNDTRGHIEGDLALKTTATAIRNHFPESLVARLGGDEFAVVISDDDMPEYEIKKRINSLIDEIDARFSPMNLGISLSIGMAHTNGNMKDVDAFIHESDQMMYRVKQAKKRG